MTVCEIQIRGRKGKRLPRGQNTNTQNFVGEIDSQQQAQMAKQPDRETKMQTAEAVSPAKRNVGRPSVSDQGAERISTRLPREHVSAIDEIIAERFGATDRSAVVRELVAYALKHMKKG